MDFLKFKWGPTKNVCSIGSDDFTLIEYKDQQTKILTEKQSIYIYILYIDVRMRGIIKS